MKSKSKKKFYQNEKFQKIFYPILFFVLICTTAICGVIIFDNNYYSIIYVSGPSMEPTLNGGVDGRHHYGKIDKSRRTIDQLNRFDVTVNYYPASWHATPDVYIIKRIWGFPGEKIQLVDTETETTFSVYNGEQLIASFTATHFTVEGSADNYARFGVANKQFTVKTKFDRNFTRQLANDEYFVMGDNWTDSSDSFYNTEKFHNTGYITNSLIQGKVVQMLGTARLENNQLVDKQKIKGMINF